MPLEEKSQLLFAFEWQDSNTQVTMQYCWTVLPQILKPTYPICESLARDLWDFQLDQGCCCNLWMTS
jgi:hypothetical protein